MCRAVALRVTADMVKAQKSYAIVTTAHPFTGIHLIEKGLDYLENYVKEVRDVIGYEVPLAMDHFGHVCVEDGIRFAKRMEPYNLAWLEDLVPWMYTDQYVRLRNSTTIPIATGEDIYLKEGFETLIDFAETAANGSGVDKNRVYLAGVRMGFRATITSGSLTACTNAMSWFAICMIKYTREPFWAVT